MAVSCYRYFNKIKPSIKIYAKINTRITLCFQVVMTLIAINNFPTNLSPAVFPPKLGLAVSDTRLVAAN